MGQPKLLLPWPTPTRPRGRVIDQVLSAWTGSAVREVVVVVRPDDSQLSAACRTWPVQLIHPDSDTADMKSSVQFALRHLEAKFSPLPTDYCFIAPADLPGLTRDIIDPLIAEATKLSSLETSYETRLTAKKAEQSSRDSRVRPSRIRPSRIIVPRFGDRVGHPALLPWSITPEIFGLADDEGVNRIVDRHPHREVVFEANQAVRDIDTPQDYDAARANPKN